MSDNMTISRLQSSSGIMEIAASLRSSQRPPAFPLPRRSTLLAMSECVALGHFGPSDTFDAEDYVGTYSDLMNMPSVARNGGEKMRTTLNLPDNLMEGALRITRFRSKKDVVIHSLRELIRKKRLEELKDMKGKIDLEIDLNRSRRRKR